MFKKFLNKFTKTQEPSAKQALTSKIDIDKIYLFESNQQELDRIIQLPVMTGKAPGYVYFVQEYMTGSFKIGKTKHIDRRMNVFNVKLPFENKLIFLIKTADHHQTELAFHHHFSDKRLEGEWFNLTRDDLAWIKKGFYTEEIHKTINSPSAVTKQLTANKAKVEEKPLTTKQIEFAKTLMLKLEQNYELNSEYAEWTQKDLNRLSGYFRFKNIGALNNLVDSGVLKTK
ncbi:GIY-YIG nuclease family protein [Planococcus sp. CPCC 101016]|uniref:GIY-YIG nuclease family protein n=1 Tax=Planococcus sp. CPCC 101016 TaxID=2599617 RepID=UPI0011B500DB|nr:GIY-YIG nuclease family protein [Planococcus sp. CPCC 101016]TWT07876.1 GIY-YIG nuclease family protein [Planococcus sp. CPCC 101016]